MKHLVASLMALSFLGCTAVERNRTDGYSPASHQCATQTDPQCVGSATAGVSIPLNPEPRKELSGRCEMTVEGQSGTRPCTGIRLVARATREGEMRTATVDGYNFKFSDLNATNYEVESTSEQYDILNNTQKLVPGQPIRLRVKTRSRP